MLWWYKHSFILHKQIWTPRVGCPDESTLSQLAKQILNGEVMRTTDAVETKMVVLQEEGNPPPLSSTATPRLAMIHISSHESVFGFGFATHPILLLPCDIGLLALSYLYTANPSMADSCSYGSTTLGITTGTLAMSTKFVLSFVVPLVYLQNFSGFFSIMSDHAPVLIEVLRGLRAGLVSIMSLWEFICLLNSVWTPLIILCCLLTGPCYSD